MIGIRRLAALAVAMAGGVSPSLAQTPPAPRDSVALDSTRRDSTLPDMPVRPHPVDSPVAYEVMAGMIASMFAPAPMALWIGSRGETRMGFLADHGAATLSVGGRFHAGQTWADAATFENVRDDLHTELQVEDYWRPHHVRYFTVRGGKLWHPRQHTAGSVTLGYVHSDGDPLQRGPELGFPLFAGTRSGTARVEPTYVFSRDGILWSYRLQIEGTIPHRLFFAGANMTWKSLTVTSDSRHDFAASAFSVLLGSTF